jgi:hypothetical protein
VDTAPEAVSTDTDAERDAVVDTDAGASAADVTTGSNPIAGRTAPTTESEYSHGR